MSSTWRRIIDRLFGGGPRDDTPPAPSRGESKAYRAHDPSTREADPRYADPLGRIVDAIANNPFDRKPAEQLAEDLSGRYGPFAVKWESKTKLDAETGWGVLGDTTVFIEGRILDDQGELVGICEQKFSRDADGYLVVENVHLQLVKEAQKKGFGKALYD
ncbi:MAG: hypothetical protein WA317_18945, partial [Mycobacterium sp.]|uniref:hypothetical protein n=1 Tax=Mycobacterium sp. TaxID=1785 RepID=UPI003CC518D7